MNKIICLYGMPACGKTTQAAKLIKELDMVQFGMGDRLREEVASGSDLGLKIKSYIDQGHLISDDLMAEVIKASSEKLAGRGIIFDGFPRIISQAKMLEEVALTLNLKIEKFFYIKVSQETAIKRLEERAESGGRVDDKDLEAVKNRLDIFKQESIKLLDYYQKNGLLIEIDGEKSIEEVYQEIKNNL